MRLRAIFVGLGCAGLLGTVLSACGSSTSTNTGSDFAKLVKEIGFPSMCSSCITSSCVSSGDTCAADNACQTIEICAGHCIIKNGTPDGLTCVGNCTPSGTSATTSTNVSNLNTCIVGACAMDCQEGG